VTSSSVARNADVAHDQRARREGLIARMFLGKIEDFEQALRHDAGRCEGELERGQRAEGTRHPRLIDQHRHDRAHCDLTAHHQERANRHDRDRS